jgi:hypothetical protein
MTLRIFEGNDRQGELVALHGWLSEAEVAEVERVVAAHGLGLRIDLKNLAGTDADGLRALGRLRAAGARLVGASPFIALLLERAKGAGAQRPSK